jgi:hypothetical protein
MNNCLEMASSGGTTNKTLGAAGMASIKLSLRATRSPNDLSATREWPKHRQCLARRVTGEQYSQHTRTVAPTRSGKGVNQTRPMRSRPDPRHRQLSYTISSSRLRLRWFSSTNFVAASSNVQRA